MKDRGIKCICKEFVKIVFRSKTKNRQENRNHGRKIMLNLVL